MEEDEIHQVFIDFKALPPVKKQDVEGEPLNRHIFTVEKFLANGNHNKVKSHFMAKGNEQDQELYPDRASPTVAIHSILTCLAVAAHKDDCKMSKVDVKGAFIQREMSGPPVYIKLH